MGSVSTINFLLWGDCLISIGGWVGSIAQTFFFHRGSRLLVIGSGPSSCFTIWVLEPIWNGFGLEHQPAEFFNWIMGISSLPDYSLPFIASQDKSKGKVNSALPFLDVVKVIPCGMPTWGPLPVDLVRFSRRVLWLFMWWVVLVSNRVVGIGSQVQFGLGLLGKECFRGSSPLRGSFFTSFLRVLLTLEF